MQDGDPVEQRQTPVHGTPVQVRGRLRPARLRREDQHRRAVAEDAPALTDLMHAAAA
jgi:hypothetical protein